MITAVGKCQDARMLQECVTRHLVRPRGTVKNNLPAIVTAAGPK